MLLLTAEKRQKKGGSFIAEYEDSSTGNCESEAKDSANNTVFDIAITLQTQRAIQYWNDSSSNHVAVIMNQVEKEKVLQLLKEGKVLPIFHTLCRPPNERLFLPNTLVSTEDKKPHAIQLSAAPMASEECQEEEEEEEVDDEISDAIQLSIAPMTMGEYDEGAVENKNLDAPRLSVAPVIKGENQEEEAEVDEKSKKMIQLSTVLKSTGECEDAEDDELLDVIQLSAAPVTMGQCDEESTKIGEVSDKKHRSYIPSFFDNGACMFKVKDLNFTWKFKKKYTEIVTELVNTPSKMVGEDIEVTKLLAPFNVDDSHGRNLITRRLSRGVVADCFAKSKRRSTYAIVGNPGIGKSWTLIYALQQALLYENVCVLFCFQKEEGAILCIRRHNKIYAWNSDDRMWATSCRSRLFNNSNVLVLLDPRESTEGGAIFSRGPRMLVMAASNNKKHMGSTKKFTPNFIRILSINSDEELKIADRKSTRLNSSHITPSRMPSSA